MQFSTEAAASLRQDYERDGIVILRNVIDADLANEASAHVEWLLEKHPDLRPEQLDTHLVADDPFWLRLVGDERLLNLAGIFIGQDIALFASHYICKPPKTGQPVLWHQDGAFWPLDPMRVITLWLAVSQSTPENGCMRVIPGTHKRMLEGLKERKDVDSVLGAEMDGEITEEDATDVVLNPGDVSVHHPNIIHGSDANTSELWRKGLTIRYIPTSTQITRPENTPFLLRGNPVPGINEYGTPPTFDPARHFRWKEPA